MSKTPFHLLPENCHVCGSSEQAHVHVKHTFWSNADAMSEAIRHDARTVLSHSPEAVYVDQTRGR